ncbi:daunorubicin resistance protein DrrA family ABC transporter ATP-binding protein [Paenibacillus glycanilyticus]|uniref:Daunorubicin resistance protein DrrA family ABC transporter ATP-binding protein n=1 Tax=Paenibacillus glycanilyticus TaxID=126569 RepID=A0ABQ6NIP6_9BACL|nr:ATP-binding cassette domain-containing protein [Paenibacillus glycanilyticus]GMK44057.1 daunorubicin resistance protein DrrA family ABC transporter ATP-binding protein [Paenibacillus glycanilyticus]
MKSMAIEVSGLRKSFGKQSVLSGLELSVPAGSVFALLGPNGAGKTTLIHILSTLIAPDGGKVLVGGYNVQTEQELVKQHISLTGQFAAVDEVLSAEENLRMIGRLSGLSSSQSRTRTEELLKAFDLVDAAKKRVKTYSGGMRRRLDLAISLVVDRPVIFLDEPTTGLDTVSRRALWDIISELASQGRTIFLTTQYLEEADQLADQIAVINGGRIVATGSAEQLKARVGGEVIELLNGQDEVIHTVPTTGSIQDISRTLNELVHSVPPGTRVNIRRPSLDDVFVALTTNGKEVQRV